MRDRGPRSAGDAVQARASIRTRSPSGSRRMEEVAWHVEVPPENQAVASEPAHRQSRSRTPCSRDVPNHFAVVQQFQLRIPRPGEHLNTVTRPTSSPTTSRRASRACGPPAAPAGEPLEPEVRSGLAGLRQSRRSRESRSTTRSRSSATAADPCLTTCRRTMRAPGRRHLPSRSSWLGPIADVAARCPFGDQVVKSDAFWAEAAGFGEWRPQPLIDGEIFGLEGRPERSAREPAPLSPCPTSRPSSPTASSRERAPSTGSFVSADVIGFTSLSERLARSGRIGAEVLSTSMDRFFTGLIDALTPFGGDVLFFGGDALFVAFFGDEPRPAGRRWRDRDAAGAARAGAPGDAARRRARLDVGRGGDRTGRSRRRRRAAAPVVPRRPDRLPHRAPGVPRRLGRDPRRRRHRRVARRDRAPRRSPTTSGS